MNDARNQLDQLTSAVEEVLRSPVGHMGDSAGEYVADHGSWFAFGKWAGLNRIGEKQVETLATRVEQYLHSQRRLRVAQLQAAAQAIHTWYSRRSSQLATDHEADRLKALARHLESEVGALDQSLAHRKAQLEELIQRRGRDADGKLRETVAQTRQRMADLQDSIVAAGEEVLAERLQTLKSNRDAWMRRLRDSEDQMSQLLQDVAEEEDDGERKKLVEKLTDYQRALQSAKAGWGELFPEIQVLLDDFGKGVEATAKASEVYLKGRRNALAVPDAEPSDTGRVRRLMQHPHYQKALLVVGAVIVLSEAFLVNSRSRDIYGVPDTLWAVGNDLASHWSNVGLWLQFVFLGFFSLLPLALGYPVKVMMERGGATGARILNVFLSSVVVLGVGAALGFLSDAVAPHNAIWGMSIKGLSDTLVVPATSVALVVASGVLMHQLTRVWAARSIGGEEEELNADVERLHRDSEAAFESLRGVSSLKDQRAEAVHRGISVVEGVLKGLSELQTSLASATGTDGGPLVAACLAGYASGESIRDQGLEVDDSLLAASSAEMLERLKAAGLFHAFR